ncbi:Phosphotransferase system, mannose/fructose/N-acetylgalactosamine [Elusimicrobium minutum Pei191]|uniref:Phosphotransferase system, mannose/fructose/N-acetylgalactosamine n=1 Tax=Elusimicrobium minutum (strain Pei191) TaxID=445932 RepID=B2KAZ7_ELUMP|nr:PTS sugar transporter subunit IIB [Elusimicrobium minutum]ACC97693.1 Phosphotransferase system, mannose/fructose/N-acetylgalactosamine [Elusimicrobium minutum Pei191]
MPIVFARVDDRLIHGQIVQGWLPRMEVDEFVVIINEADNLVKSLLRISLPSNYGLQILNNEDAVKYLKETDKKIFLLFSSLEDVDVVIRKGLGIKNLNVGGLHYREGRNKVLTDVYLDEKEKQMLKNFMIIGIKLDGRSVPKEPHNNLESLLCS